MAKILDLPLSGVNLMCAAMVALQLAGCGAPPTPVALGNAPAYGTYLGNQRRALYENEVIPSAPQVEWDIDAGAGMRGTLLLLDSALVTATTNRQLLAYHRRDGRRYWERRFGNAVTSTVLYDRNMLYIGTDESDGSLHAHELTRGRERWKQRIGAVSATPLLDGGVVYAGTGDGTVAALHTEDGRRGWRVGLHGAVTETLVDGGTYIVAFTAADSVFALRKADGGMVARAGLPGSAAAAPALSGNTIVVPVHPTGVVGLDAASLGQSWRVETSAPVLTAPAVTRDGVVYVAARDGSVYRITNGVAQRIVQVPHALSGSLTLARDHLLLGSYDGTLLAVSLDGKVVWTHRFDDSIIAPVAVGDQSVYVPFLNGRIVKLR